jgi:creatinine amidohydrolase
LDKINYKLMKKILNLLTIQFLAFLISNAQAPNLSSYMEELTSPEFARAVDASARTCIIPLGILEKHGPHLPLSTDLLTAREIAKRAAFQEYSLIFPPYYIGQIFEAKQQPGTFAYSHDLIFQMLQETCEELARNGINKIILLNGHGGNDNFLHYFCQLQLEKNKEFAVILFKPAESEAYQQSIDSLMTSPLDWHAGELETSVVEVIRPDLVQKGRAPLESGTDMARLDSLPHGYTGIWWYAKFPNHYAGDGSKTNPIIGELYISNQVKQLVELIRYLKNNNNILELQDEFYLKSNNPQ